MTTFAGRIWQDGKATKGVLHVEGGRVVKIAKSGKADHNFGNRLILPGAIDIHVHFRDPGHPHKEDATTGSTAAAFGGVTGFVDMPNTVPPTTTTRALEAKLKAFSERSVIDYGAWAGGTWFTDDLPHMLPHAAGVKTYLGATTGDLLLDDMERFKTILAACAAAGKPLVLHCEAQRVLERMKRQETTVPDHDAARPPLAEVESIYDVMKALAGIRPAPRVHVCHVASKEAVQAARAAKFSSGVCPHHFLLDTAGDWLHAYGKVNPPIRGAAQRDTLWKLLVDGTIPIVESDHAPHTRTEKEDAFHSAPAGIPGVETLLPLLLARATAGDIPLERVVDATSRAPAALLSLKTRGALAPGNWADFTVVDPDDVGTVDAKDLHSKSGRSPFEGHDAVWPTHTYVRGEAVVEDRTLVATPGRGRPLLDP